MIAKRNENISELQGGLLDVICLVTTTPTDDFRAAQRALGAIKERAIRALFVDVPDCLRDASKAEVFRKAFCE